MQRTLIPLPIKLGYTLFVALLVPVYWLEHGPQNFLWGSDIALFVTLIAVWMQNRLLASMMAIAVLLPEMLWIIDFVLRLMLGADRIPIRGTRYMYDPEIPLLVRGLSLFHLFLPALLVWLVYRLGYDTRALLCQTLFAWLVFPVTYLVTEPAANINWVHGFGDEPQTLMPGPLFVAMLMLLFPTCVYLPTHLLLAKLFAAKAP